MASNKFTFHACYFCRVISVKGVPQTLKARIVVLWMSLIAELASVRSYSIILNLDVQDHLTKKSDEALL